jgi:hypothetical protein
MPIPGRPVSGRKVGSYGRLRLPGLTVSGRSFSSQIEKTDILGLSSAGIQAGTRHNLERGHHLIMHGLDIEQSITALLVEDSRDAVSVGELLGLLYERHCESLQ